MTKLDNETIGRREKKSETDCSLAKRTSFGRPKSAHADSNITEENSVN